MAQHQARKRFGQHFLTDAGVIAQIVQAIAPQAGEVMVEIGPGLAAMTQPLVERLGLMDYWRATKSQPDVCETENVPFCRALRMAPT